MSAALQAALREALPIGLALGSPTDEGLWPGENVPRATKARLQEFTAGRSAARSALRLLGHPECSVPMQMDRSPRWPQGVTGSISHCDGACLALLGWRRDWAGIGLDLEPANALETLLWPEILTSDERAALPDSAQGLAALKIFMAKEAVYKAQYSVTGKLFGYDGLHVLLRESGFEARFTIPVGPFFVGYRVVGGLVSADGLIAAHCLIAKA